MQRHVWVCRVVALWSGLAIGAQPASGQSPATHPFGLDDFTALREARPIAMSPNGNTVLYMRCISSQSGPAHFDWHTISTAGGADRKLAIPDGFTPAGFMHRRRGAVWHLPCRGLTALWPSCPFRPPQALESG